MPALAFGAELTEAVTVVSCSQLCSHSSNPIFCEKIRIRKNETIRTFSFCITDAKYYLNIKMPKKTRLSGKTSYKAL